MWRNKSFFTIHDNHVLGDCSYCGHSIAYHMPFMGCMKCSCSEFH